MKLIIITLLFTLITFPVFADKEVEDISISSDSLNSINSQLAPNFTPSLSSPGQIISQILPIAIIFGGIILFVMIIAGGFTMLTNPTNPEAQGKGKARITYAIAGFIILFSAYWITQVVEIIFKLEIV